MKDAKAGAFTLVESVLALAVASIALVALLGLHLAALKTAETAENLAQAVLLAQAKLEEKLAVDYPQVGTESGRIEQNGLQLDWKTRVKPLSVPALDRAGVGRLREVSTEVGWKQGNARRYVRLTTWIADRKWK